MAAYDYRCEQDGVFELTLPLGTAPEIAACPECGEDAPRIFSAPLTVSTRRIDGPMGPMTPSGPRPAGQPPMRSLPMTAPMRGGFPPH